MTEIVLDVYEDVYENLTKEEILDILAEMEQDHAQMYDNYIRLEKELAWWVAKAKQLASLVDKTF